MDALRARLTRIGSVLVAFSGGRRLRAPAGRRRARSGPTASSRRPRSRPRCRRRARRGARRSRPALGVRHLTPATHEMDREGYRANAGDRCYFCKAELLDVLGAAGRRARRRRTSPPAPTPTTPSPGFRPGIRAAAERGAVTPLRDAGLTKAQVRAASRGAGACPPGTSRPRPACPAGSRTASQVTPRPAGPGRAGRGRRCGRALAEAGLPVARPAGARPRRPGPGRGRRGPGGRGRGAGAGCSPRSAAAGFDRGRGRPARLPVRLDERAAAEPERYR